MKVFCVFPAHRRAPITVETIRMLDRQTVKPRVILVGDSSVEADIAAKTGCEYIQYPNRPLASKWQAGIWRTGDLGADAILIIGSDTWLTPNWIETYLHRLDKFDVVGCSEWHILQLERKSLKVARRGYRGPRASEPCGLGRMYSRRALQKMSWVLYKERKNKHVDGVAMRRAQMTGCSIGVINRPGVLALEVKCAQWKMMHGLDGLHENRNLAHHPDIVNPEGWLRDNFPGSPGAINRLRRQVWQK